MNMIKNNFVTLLFTIIFVNFCDISNACNNTTLQRIKRDTRLSDSIFKLSLQLQNLIENDNLSVEKNFVISPFGFSLALGQIAAASNINLKNLIFEFMGWSLTELPNQIHEDFSRVLNKINNVAGVNRVSSFKTHIDSALFYDNSIGLKPSFESKLKKCYDTKIIPLPLYTDFSSSQRMINYWASKTSDNLINQFTVSPSSAAVLANIVLFKGNWLEPFISELTRRDVFHLNEKQTTNATFMIGELELLYGEDNELNCKIIQLPYETEMNRNISMYMILPKQYNLKTILKNITPGKFENMLSSLSERTVAVKIPKLEIQTTFSLKMYLEKFHNMKKQQNSPVKGHNKRTQINFNLPFGTFNSTNFVLSDIVQETVLNVYEKGTTAASLTGGIINYDGFSKNFLANQPYIFVIRDDDAKIILYWGTIYNPAQL